MFSVVFAIVVVSGAKWGVGVGEGDSALPIVTSSLSSTISSCDIPGIF